MLLWVIVRKYSRSLCPQKLKKREIRWRHLWLKWCVSVDNEKYTMTNGIRQLRPIENTSIIRYFFTQITLQFYNKTHEGNSVFSFCTCFRCKSLAHWKLQSDAEMHKKGMFFHWTYSLNNGVITFVDSTISLEALVNDISQHLLRWYIRTMYL